MGIADIEMEALTLLQESNPVMLRFMSAKQKEALKKKLEDQQKKLKTDSALHAWFQAYLNFIAAENATKKAQQDFLSSHNTQIAESYRIGYFDRLKQTIKNDPWGFSVSFLVSSNEFRLLHVVWGLGSLEYFIKFFAADPLKTETVNKLLAACNVTGNISWILYYIRLILNCIRLYRNKELYDELKYWIANDSVWGTINLACFMWLIGSCLLDYCNNMGTAFLLVFDCLSTIKKVLEEKTKGIQAIDEIEKNIRKLKSTHASQEEIEEEERKLKRAQFELRYEKYYKGAMDLSYTILLVVAWAAFSAFFVNVPTAITTANLLSAGSVMTLSAANILAFNLGGAIGCYVLSIINTIACAAFEIYKTKQYIHQVLHQEAEDLVEKFKASPLSATNQRIMLYLKIQDLMNEITEKERLVNYQWAKLARVVIFDVIMPIVFISTIMFVPSTLPLGIPMLLVLLGAALALSAISKPIFESLYACCSKPKPEKFVAFDEKTDSTFRSFCNNPNLKHFNAASTPGTNPRSFYHPSTSKSGSFSISNSEMIDSHLLPI